MGKLGFITSFHLPYQPCMGRPMCARIDFTLRFFSRSSWAGNGRWRINWSRATQLSFHGFFGRACRGQWCKSRLLDWGCTKVLELLQTTWKQGPMKQANHPLHFPNQCFLLERSIAVGGQSHQQYLSFWGHLTYS